MGLEATCARKMPVNTVWDSFVPHFFVRNGRFVSFHLGVADGNL